MGKNFEFSENEQTITADADESLSYEQQISRRHLILTSSLLGMAAVAGGSALLYLNRNQWLSWLAPQDNQARDSDNPNKEKRKQAKPVYEAFDVKAYKSFLKERPFRYISAREILQPHFRTRGNVTNTVPPKHLWKNILPTLEVANEIRRRLGVKLSYITSAYRSPAYNAKCNGAVRYSQHTKNRALDIVYDCDSRKAFDMAIKLRHEGYFRGGVGFYKNFIHIDTRGKNATWGV